MIRKKNFDICMQNRHNGIIAINYINDKIKNRTSNTHFIFAAIFLSSACLNRASTSVRA